MIRGGEHNGSRRPPRLLSIWSKTYLVQNIDQWTVLPERPCTL